MRTVAEVLEARAALEELEVLADVQLWELRETLSRIRALKGARA